MLRWYQRVSSNECYELTGLFNCTSAITVADASHCEVCLVAIKAALLGGLPLSRTTHTSANIRHCHCTRADFDFSALLFFCGVKCFVSIGYLVGCFYQGRASEVKRKPLEHTLLYVFSKNRNGLEQAR